MSDLVLNELSTFNFRSLSLPKCNFQLNYKDHLGNNRLSYTLDPATNQIKILEENHYYPFGLKHGAYNQTRKGIKYKEQAASKKEVKQVMPEEVKFKYYYNSKEWQDEFGLNWYDYGARNYQADLGRWFSQDPLSEKFYQWSPYHYALNNPILLIDRDGKEGEWHWEGNVLVSDMYDNANTLSDFLSISLDAAEEIIKKENLLTYSTNTSNNLAGTIVPGQELYTIDRNTPYSDFVHLNDNIGKYKRNHFIINFDSNGNFIENYHFEGRTAEIQAFNVVGTVFSVLQILHATVGLAPDNNFQSKRIINFSRAPKVNLRSDIIKYGGRSGNKVKFMTGPPNSAFKGSNGRMYITNSKGQVIWDISNERAKPVIPGKGFGKKQTPTSYQLKLLDRLWSQ